MDKNALKSFAVESRRQLIEDVIYQANLLGINKERIQCPVEEAKGMQAFDIGGSKLYVIYDEDIEKRNNLIKEIQEKGFDNVIEEVAYTWFNRIIAIRYMEVNDYLPTRVRVLSSEKLGKTEPDIIKESPNINLSFTNEDTQYIFKLKEENKIDDLFRFLFIKQCNELNEILPKLFEKTCDYAELLFNLHYYNGVIYNLINNIDENDFKNQVEIIGWLYQYYISEKKELTTQIHKKQLEKEDIPAATQLFTPDWIVKYMVDNSLGKYWIERNEKSLLKESLVYYFEEAQQNQDIQNKNYIIREKNLNLENIKFFDPCMGSGHILVYAFDVFFKIYSELGYSKSNIPELILKNNIYGLDIDDRAYQLAYFAILMRARYYDKKILNKNIILNIYSIQDTKDIPIEIIEFIKESDVELGNEIYYLKEMFKSGKEFGSLIQLKQLDFYQMEYKLNNIFKKTSSTLDALNHEKEFNKYIFPLIKQAEIISSKYDIVVTNPPYLNKLNNSFKEFAKKYYKNYSKDLFSMFIYRNLIYCKKEGYVAFMTPLVWMYIKTYNQLRNFIINNKSFVNLIEFEYSVLSELDATVPICSFILSNINYNLEYQGTFLKLSSFKGGLEIQKQKTLEAKNFDVDYKFISNNKKFFNIPGNTIAYWADKNLINDFKNGIPLKNIADLKVGIQTGDTKSFLRYWYEVNIKKIGFKYGNNEDAKNSRFKWFPHNKGGYYRKWYGNQDYIINWENDGNEIKNCKKSRPQNINFCFKESLSWSRTSSGNVAFRYYPEGFLFDSAGCSLFVNSKMKYIFGFLNSCVATDILNLISPTLNYEVGHIASLPIIFNNGKKDEIENLVDSNIKICESDWNNYETSWNFDLHPFLKFKKNSMANIYNCWVDFKLKQFNFLKFNEEKINEIFSKIYSVDMDCSVKDKHISLKKANKVEDVKSFLSFFVGCLFGRYSLDEEGLIFAGGEYFDLSNYSKFVPDEDNIIPILDSEYFDDDVVGRFVEFVKVAFGEENLEANLDFIAGALKNKGKTSREVIRSYFLNDFFKDHVKMYKKCPIYWQFDSGKEDGFKCLVYMHRYSPDLVARVRTDYLHKTQKAIESQISYEQNIKENSGNSKDQARADKRIKKLTKQLDETRRYDEALAHVASQNITIDLDDGVKVNYAKFQNVEVSKEGQKVKKINLLKKI